MCCTPAGKTRSRGAEVGDVGDKRESRTSIQYHKWSRFERRTLSWPLMSKYKIFYRRNWLCHITITSSEFSRINQKWDWIEATDAASYFGSHSFLSNLSLALYPSSLSLYFLPVHHSPASRKFQIQIMNVQFVSFAWAAVFLLWMEWMIIKYSLLIATQSFYYYKYE